MQFKGFGKKLIWAGNGDFFYGYYALSKYGIRPVDFIGMESAEKAFVMAAAELDAEFCLDRRKQFFRR